MSKPVYFVGGGKGGVGKSIVAMALLDYLTHRKQEEVLLIETDTSNPDVLLCYEPVESVQVERANLDEDEGWMKTADLCEDHFDKIVVINTAARNNNGIVEYGKILSGSLRELQRELVALWIINTERDGLELLAEFMRELPGAPVYVVRNLKHGKEPDFKLYNGSELRKAVEAHGGSTLNFPKASSVLTEHFFTHRLAIATTRARLKIGARAALDQWRNELAQLFVEVVDESEAAESA